MIIEDKAVEINGKEVSCGSKTEILCASCKHDVSATDVEAKKCSNCGASLDAVEQNVAIEVTSLPLFGTMF